MTSLNPIKIIPVIIVLFTLSYSLRIESVSDRVKREANLELYPDWLPFNNEHGEKTGEIVTEIKAKPKKRLAPPANFILRAVAEPEGDDYYEKGQGESDGDDYYEKKDWSDSNRPAEPIDTSTALNHGNLSDIEGLVNIITQVNPITEILKRQKKVRGSADVGSTETSDDEDKDKEDSDNDKKEKKSNDPIEEQKPDETKHEKEKQTNEEDVEEYDEASAETKKPEISDEERRENEAKKAKILSSVDDLKARHAFEQRIISEKVKEEEMYKEELERDKIKSTEDSDKYSSHPRKVPDYDDFDEKEGSRNDKYKLNHHKPKKSTTQKPKRITTRKLSPKNTAKHVESGKLSVFKNPRAYMVYEDDDSSEQPTKTTKPSTKPTRLSKKLKQKEVYSSKYSTPSTSIEENVRISLVPEDNETKVGEPTMFFPKRRTKKRKQKTTTPAPSDSSVAESIPVKTAKDLITAFDVTSVDSTAPETAPSGEDNIVTGPDTAPSSTISKAFSEESAPSAEGSSTSAVDTAASAAEAPSAVGAIDAIPASSEHKKEHEKDTGKNYHHEKGGEREHHSEHEASHGEHGKKAYEGVHKDTKTAKGHHDKEDHHGRYKDHGGIDKHHHDEKNHYGAHHHEEHGKKHAKYEESGKHSKGHSTKGSHDIHKKEEYEKNVEFFEEEGDSAEEEKHGGHNQERSHSSGGHFKNGNLNAAYTGHDKGESGHFNKGGKGYGHKGHRSSAGHDSHAKHGGGHHSEGAGAAGKKWIYHHGTPAKTANLVVIDRRGDQYYHGPQYYG